MRRVPLTCRATIGQVGNVDHENITAARQGAAGGRASGRRCAARR
jgi:ribosomal protein L2